MGWVCPVCGVALAPWVREHGHQSTVAAVGGSWKCGLCNTVVMPGTTHYCAGRVSCTTTTVARTA